VKTTLANRYMGGCFSLTFFRERGRRAGAAGVDRDLII
jgi:hypothetical protein